MIPEALLERARNAIAAKFCGSTGQVMVKAAGQDSAGYPTGAWSPDGDPFACSLYSPKGTEVPEPLALLNKEIYWLAYVENPPIDARKRVVVGEIVYHVHTTEQDRTNALLFRAMVSRLGLFTDPITGYQAVYREIY